MELRGGQLGGPQIAAAHTGQKVGAFAANNWNLEVDCVLTSQGINSVIPLVLLIPELHAGRVDRRSGQKIYKYEWVGSSSMNDKIYCKILRCLSYCTL